MLIRYLLTLLLLIIITAPISMPAAAPLTRGNTFAEGLAGCSAGMAINLLNTFITTFQFNQIQTIQYCITGAILSISTHIIIELSNISRESFNPDAWINSKIPMVYPETPGKEY